MRAIVLFVVFAALLASGDALARRHTAFGSPQQQKKKAQAQAAAAGKTYTFDGVKVTQKQIDDFTAALKTAGSVMKAAKTLTHWSSFEQCIRWGIQGYVNDGEMQYLTRPEAGAVRARAGPGMYLADSDTTSRPFGLCATSFQIDANTLMWKEDTARRIFGFTKSDILRFKTELGRVVPFIDFYGPSSSELWYVTHHTGLVSKVSMNWKLTMQRLRGGNIPTFIAQLGAMNWNDIGVDERVKNKWRDSIGFFTSLYHLMYYLDPISFMRAVQKQPDDPWQAFEPQYFGRYKDVRTQLQYDAYIKKATKGVAQAKYNTVGADFPIGCTFGAANMDANTWANKVLDEVFASFPKQFAGQDMKFRNKYVRAGGDEPGRTFYATGYQVTEMSKNPFLKVGAVAKKVAGSTPGDYLTCYLYPDLKEWVKPSANPAIAPYISVADVQKLAAAGDQAAYEKFLRALLVGVLKTLYGKPVADVSHQVVDDASPGIKWNALFVNSAAVDAMQRLISIHPFGNYNGRSVRMFAQLAAMECIMPIPIPAVGDLDTVESLDTFSRHVDVSTAIYEDLQRQMLDVFWTYTSNPANGAPKNKEYFSSGKIKWNDIAKSLLPLGITYKDVPFTDAQFTMIEKRQWNPFFDSIGGSTWTSRRGAAAKPPSLPFDDNGKTYDVNDKGELVPTDPAVKVSDLYWQA